MVVMVVRLILVVLEDCRLGILPLFDFSFTGVSPGVAAWRETPFHRGFEYTLRHGTRAQKVAFLQRSSSLGQVLFVVARQNTCHGSRTLFHNNGLSKSTSHRQVSIEKGDAQCLQWRDDDGSEVK